MPELALGAVIAFDFQTWDVQDEIRLIRSLGIDRVQIYRNYAHGVRPESIRDLLAGQGIAVDSLHGYFRLEGFDGPPFDPSAQSEAERRAAVEILRREADFARTLGCTDVVVHPVSAAETARDGFREAALTTSAEDLAGIGRQTGARFLLENMPPGVFGCDAALLRRVVDRVGGPHLGLVFDSGHAALAGDPVGAVRTMGPRLWGVHLHDNRGAADDHLIPGTGSLPFREIARALAEVKYAGTFMIEVYRPTAEVRRDLTPDRIAGIQRLRRLASGL